MCAITSHHMQSHQWGCIVVDQQCRGSNGKVKIEGYTRVSDEEAHQCILLLVSRNYLMPSYLISVLVMTLGISSKPTSTIAPLALLLITYTIDLSLIFPLLCPLFPMPTHQPTHIYQRYRHQGSGDK